MRIGIGYDAHRFAENRNLIIGGVKIEYDKGLLGHSDADVLIHSIIDAVLGALGKGDIGTFFPDTDPKFKNIDSKLLLKKTCKIMKDNCFEIINIDSIIIAEKPKMKNHIEKMKKVLSEVLEIKVDKINIKATTTEKMGFIGREEGIAAQSVVLLDNNQKV
jgi:2-C-methyl-D-erythritol 2,4-cyclodiphosphate synthase